MRNSFARITLTFAAAAILILAAAAPAAAETQTFREQTTFSFFVPCADGGLGEEVEGIARLNAVFGITDDGAGGQHIHVQFKLHGSGLGSVTGDTYRLHADVPEIFLDRGNANAGGSFNAAVHYSLDLIGMGDAVNYHLEADAQITQNANGVVTMEKGDLTPVETCN